MVVAAEVAVRGGLRVDRPAQVEVAQDRCRAEVEVLVGSSSSIRVDRDLARCRSVSHGDRDRVRDADRVGDLHLAAVGEPGRDDVLGHVAGRVGGRAVDLRRILARERAAAVTGRAAVGVDDDLAAGQAGVAHRAADHELAGRVDVDEVARRSSRFSSYRCARQDRVQRRARSRSGLISVSASQPVARAGSRRGRARSRPGAGGRRSSTS